MSVQQIFKAKEILSMLPHARKAQVVKPRLEGEVTSMAPASILRKHSNTTDFLDKPFSALLSRKANRHGHRHHDWWMMSFSGLWLFALSYSLSTIEEP